MTGSGRERPDRLRPQWVESGYCARDAPVPRSPEALMTRIEHVGAFGNYERTARSTVTTMPTAAKIVPHLVQLIDAWA
jgi:hypothetical protein